MTAPDVRQSAHKLAILKSRFELELSMQNDTYSDAWRERCIVFMIVRKTIENDGRSDAIRRTLSASWPKERVDRLWREAEALWLLIFNNKASVRNPSVSA